MAKLDFTPKKWLKTLRSKTSGLPNPRPSDDPTYRALVAAQQDAEAKVVRVMAETETAASIYQIHLDRLQAARVEAKAIGDDIAATANMILRGRGPGPKTKGI